MTIEEALGKAADIINANIIAFGHMKAARSMSNADFDIVKSKSRMDRIENNLKGYVLEANPESVGWWYGRYTDPRRNK